MQRLPLVHLTVDQPAVGNLPVIQQWLLQSFTPDALSTYHVRLEHAVVIRSKGQDR